jgi:hypoxanthine phosphoribosyltransferase
VKKITSPDNNKIAIMTLPGTVWQEPCTMDQPRKEIISIIIPQFESVFDSIIMISPSGVIPAGMLAAAAGIGELMIAQVDFPPDTDLEKSKLLSWPNFTHFPPHEMLLEKRVLVVNNAWGSGRTTWSVYKQVETVGGIPCSCVLHYNPYRNLLKCKPDYYGAITDAFIIYPWDLDQAGPNRVLLENGGRG